MVLVSHGTRLVLVPVKTSNGDNMGMPLERKKKRKKKNRNFILIEGHKLNEKTGVLEPYKKKVYWQSHGY